MSEYSESPLSGWQRFYILLALVFAGEAIFFLPFVIPRVFRPTVLDVFQIDNYELGSYISVYGFVALVAYVLGGPLSDRFAPYKLMCSALFLTALGGIFLYTIPDTREMYLLYGYWGLSTIMLFWAPMLRVTRILGGSDRQGAAFGLLDGGRGLMSAIISSLSILVFSYYIVDTHLLDPADRLKSFRLVVLFYGSIVLLAGIVLYLVLSRVEQSSFQNAPRIELSTLKKLIKRPVVWFQAIIILCAYSGYKATDDFSLMGYDILGYDEVDSARISTMSLWLRPVAAIGAGLLADRVSTSLMIVLSFIFLILGAYVIGTGIYVHAVVVLVYVSIFSMSIAVYALRGLYFAIMHEARLPIMTTGTAVGLCSLIGYLPDIYMGPLMGIFLDSFPGELGHRYLFLIVGSIAFMGLLFTLAFRWYNNRITTQSIM